MNKEIDPSVDGPVTENVSALYDRLCIDRQEYLDRARENALVTIPSLMPPEGHYPGQPLYVPYQSIGSHGVNTLSNKLTMTLLPANAPVYTYSTPDSVVADLAEDENARSEVEKKLNEVERSVMDELEGLGIRADLTEALKQLIVAGNVLLYLPKKGGLKTYRLDRYVVQRDFEGNFLRAVIKETVSIETLAPEVQAMLADSSHLPSEHQTVDERDNKNEVDVYTCFKRDGDHVETYQTIREVVLPKSRGRWPLDKSPVMPLRWGGLRSEDYGRGYVDDYIGDLTAVDRLSENIRGGIAAMTKINPMVNPTGLTKARDVAKAKNLEIIAGRKDDVTMLQFEKQADLKFAGEYINSIIMRLQTAFMLNKSASRDAERVTAEEIRQVISDIDDNMGGIYSLLAGDLQKPLVLRIIYRMEKEKKIPRLSDLKGPDGKPIATPKVVTGVEALGRGHDFNKYVTLVNQIILPLKEAGLAEININDLIKRSAVSLNIDIDGLLKSSEDKKADQDAMMQVQQQKMLQDVVKGATPNVSKAMADGVATQMTDGGPDGQPV